MKLNEGIKHKGRPYFIPSCSRDDLPDFFVERGYKVGAEIGVYKGHYSKVLCESGKLKVYSIDPWREFPDLMHPRGQKRLDTLYEQSKKLLAQYPNNTIIRKTSMEALKDFEDESLDFVYIDGNHRFPYVAEDIYHWGWKIKPGGILCGHDYAYFRHRFPGAGMQVKEIVNAFAIAYDLNFWVLGKFKDKVRDRYRSWMFIKDWKNLERVYAE